MGRKKIQISRIGDERNRQVSFYYRYEYQEWDVCLNIECGFV